MAAPLFLFTTTFSLKFRDLIPVFYARYQSKRFYYNYLLFIFTHDEPHFIVYRRNFCTVLLRM